MPTTSKPEHDARQVSGIYVDIENLQEYAQPFLRSLMTNWPADVPPLGIVYLYVRADLQLTWQMWATSQFPNLKVVVRGVQHVTRNISKNSADIALCLDAVSDFLLDKMQFIIVVSDDSDFVALFGKIYELNMEQKDGSRSTPFLWMVTDREDTRSSVLKEFSPNNFIRVFGAEPEKPTDTFEPSEVAAPLLDRSANGVSNHLDTPHQIAVAIIESIPLGAFKSTDCQSIIRGRWSDHALANLNGPRFGIQFSSSILPILKEYGVKEPNPSRKPKRFEMTAEAKDNVLL